MEATQMLRLLGGTDIEEVIVGFSHGEHVVFWEDIMEVFPGVQRVKHGRVTMNKLKSSEGSSITPYRIKYRPGVILDVISSVLVETPAIAPMSGQGPTDQQAMSPTTQPVSAISEGNSLQLPSTEHRTSMELAGDSRPETPLGCFSEKLPAYEARKSPITPQPRSTTSPDYSRQCERPSTPDQIAHTTKAASSTPPIDVEFTTDRTRLRQMKERLHDATIGIGKTRIYDDQLTLIRKRASAIFSQSCGFDCTIPRAFVVLPEEPVIWNPETTVRTKFRLYFICTCGSPVESAKKFSASENGISTIVHLTKHEGYVVKNPASFFREHGPCLVVALETLKASLAISSADSPFTSTIVAVTFERADYSLKYIRKIRFNMLGASSDEAGSVNAHADMSSYLKGVEKWGKLTLDQLESHLVSDGSGNFLGDMYHVVSEDGHFDWVCRDEYRSRYTEKRTQKLHNVVELAGGKFNEQLGKVELPENSSVEAATLLESMQRAKRVLDLHFCICDIEAFEAMREALGATELFTLRLDFCRRITFDHKPFPMTELFTILHHIQRLPTMKLIVVSVRPVEYTELLTIQSIKSDILFRRCKLQFELSAGQSEEDEIRFLAHSLKNTSKHSALRLRGNQILCQYTKLFTDALAVNSTLRSLDLQDNFIFDKGAIALAAALRSNTGLTFLNLGKNSIGDVGIKAVTIALKTNWTLTTLLLNSTRIGPDGAKAISLVLKENRTLTTLDLENTSIKAEGAQALSEALKSNWTLVHLALGSNSIGNSGAHALFEALDFNSSLATLSLERNSIGVYGLSSTDDGLRSMPKLLKENSTLQKLSLHHNRVGDRGLGAIAEALESNSTLKELHLQSNYVGDVGAKAFADALKVNTTLRTLNLGDNSRIGQGGALALVEILKKTQCNIAFATVS